MSLLRKVLFRTETGRGSWRTQMLAFFPSKWQAYCLGIFLMSLFISALLWNPRRVYGCSHHIGLHLTGECDWVCFGLQMPLPGSGLCWWPPWCLVLSQRALCSVWLWRLYGDYVLYLFTSLLEASGCTLLHSCLTILGSSWGQAETSPLRGHLLFIGPRIWFLLLSCGFWITHMRDTCSFYSF